MKTPHRGHRDVPVDARLADFLARHPGLSRDSAISLLVEEGLRMDAHPGVLFREGPTGRRAVLAGGPDVWEAVRAVSSTRKAVPSLDAHAAINLTAEVTGVSARHLALALSYYEDYPSDINDALAQAEALEQEGAQRR